MRRLRPGFSIIRSTILMLVACTSRIAVCQVEGETLTVMFLGGVPLEMVRVPAGSFEMGSPDTERSRGSDEGPAHTVTFGYDFYMGKTEVTQAQWLALTGSWPGTAPGSDLGLGESGVYQLFETGS